MKLLRTALGLWLAWHGWLEARIDPYLPLQLSSYEERMIERMLVIGEEPILTRPVRVFQLRRALENGCSKDPVLCAEVKGYLERLDRRFGVQHAGFGVYATNGESDTPKANQRGARENDSFDAALSAYGRFDDAFLVNVGGVLRNEELWPENSYVSLGTEVLRLDVGYRPRWLSPFEESAMLWSTEAPPIASVTISNDRPLTDYGFSYELFAGQLSHSDRILWDGGYTSGKPSVVGVHLSIRPVPWLAIGGNRVFVFGGGERGGTTIEDFLRGFFDPSGADNTASGEDKNAELGNQQASLTARMVTQTLVPVAFYMEFAGEDTSDSKRYRLGNSALQVGLHLPEIARSSEIIYEYSEWQNAWYVHSIYKDGTKNEGYVLGHWMGDQRLSDTVGSSHTLKYFYHRADRSFIALAYRQLDFADYYEGDDYERAIRISLEYNFPLNDLRGEIEAAAGNDCWGNRYASTGFRIEW